MWRKNQKGSPNATLESLIDRVQEKQIDTSELAHFAVLMLLTCVAEAVTRAATTARALQMPPWGA